MNAAEWGCCLVCIALQVLLFRFRKRSWSAALTAGVTVLPSAVAASYACAHFLSWDESYIFYDIVNFYGGRLRQWEFGSFRCTITLLGPLLHAVQSVLPVTKDIVLMGAKALHWCIGVAAVTLVTDQAHRYLFPRTSYRLFHAVTFNGIMLLPVTGLALKTLNYDLLSMMPGVLGCIWCAAGVQPPDKRLLFAGMITLTCASHEKLIASPFLWLSLAVIPVRIAVASKGSFFEMALTALRWSAAAVSASFLTVAASFALVYLTHGPGTPPLNADQITACWMSCLWPLSRMFGIAVVPETADVPLHDILYQTGARMAGIMFMLFIFAVVAGSILRQLNRKERFSALCRRRLLQVLPYLRIGLTAVVAVSGVIAGYTLQTRIWPLIPVADGHYLPTMTFNGIAHHFGCRTLFTHTIASMLWACSVFVNALPTPFLVLLVAGSMMRVIVKRGENTVESIRTDILFLMFTSVPLLYGTIQMPLYPRYFNLFLAGSVVTGLGGLQGILPIRQVLYAGALPAMVLAATFAEVVPFEPLGAAFRPVWSNYSAAYENGPEFGKVTPWYPGWGEELYCAYEKIEKVYHHRNDTVTLYYNFPAGLIKPKPGVRLSAMPAGHGTIPCSYGENDYYIISRNGVSSYPYIPFPYGVPVLFTVADRGFVKAWVFRGSDLATAGFSFPRAGSGSGTGGRNE